MADQGRLTLRRRVLAALAAVAPLLLWPLLRLLQASLRIEYVGDEAQWCVFDPIVSALYGQRFLATGDLVDRDAQTWHFNRSLAHISSDWRCPELYYKSGGVLVTNPHSPLMWTQANILLALAAMRRTAD